MTNYYEELALDQSTSSSELLKELMMLETVWHQREYARPDLAAAKLALITEARKVFATTEEKAAYDRALFAAPAEEAPADPDAERRVQYQRWYGDARQYYESGQYDLAKTAAEKAMNYASGEDDAGFYDLAAWIYRKNNDLTSAMTYINRAIVQQPDEAEYYISKAMFLEQQYLNACNNNYSGNPSIFSAQERETLGRAEALAAQTGNSDAQGRAMGCRAFSLYNHDSKDEAAAEQLAQEAIRIGDRWGNAQRVLDAIAKARQEEEERRRQQEEEEQRRRKANEEWLAKQRAAKQAAKRRAAMKKFIAFLSVVLPLVGIPLTIGLALVDRGVTNLWMINLQGLPRLDFGPLVLLALLINVAIGTNFSALFDSYLFIGLVYFLWVIAMFSLLPSIYAEQVSTDITTPKTIGVFLGALLITLLIGNWIRRAFLDK